MRDPAHYRPDIDGWRAIAVLAVIAHHIDKAWLPGGYLGVDVFFVISGFVISLSLFERKAPTFRAFIADFYARRVRRLLPSLAAYVFVAAIAVWFIDPTPRQPLGTGIAALFGASNFVLTFQHVDYFSRSTELNAFTHTWSLGVEEQFYLIFPLILWSLAKGARTNLRTYAAVLGAAAAVSYGVFIVTAEAFPVFSYYQLAPRFWELAAGALAFLVARRAFRIGALAPLLAVIVLAGAFLLPIEQRIAGTTLAVAATAVLLVATPASAPLNAALMLPALRWIGLISYPLYLWHWGVLAISRFTVGVSATTLPAQLALMTLLAWASYRYLETPVRRAGAGRPPRGALLAALCVALVGTGLLVTLMRVASIGPLRSAMSDSIPPAFLPLPGSGESYLRHCAVDGQTRLLKPDTVARCTAPPLRPGANTIWAFGDSHAGHLQAMLYAIREQTGLGAFIVETPGTPFPSLAETAAAVSGRQMFETVAENFRPGDIVLLGRLYLERQGAPRPLPDAIGWAAEAGALAERLAPRGVRVMVMGPLPMFRFEAVQSCVRRFGADCSVERAPLAESVRETLAALEKQQAAHPNMIVFDPFTFFCPPAETRCTPLRDGRTIFRDKDHLNVVGSAMLAAPTIERLGLSRWPGQRN